MTWRDRRVTAAFADRELKIKTISVKFGRRNAIYETPLIDGGIGQDLGKTLRGFSISCVFVGDDHDLEATSFVELLESTPSGMFRHPFLSSVLCQLDGDAELTQDESARNSTSVSFSLRAIEIPSDQGIDTEALAVETMTIALDEVDQDFQDDFTVEDAPNYTVDAAASDSVGTMGALRQRSVEADQLLDTPESIVSQYDDFATDAQELVRTPDVLMARMQNLIGRTALDTEILGEFVGDLSGWLRDALTAGDDGPEYPTNTTGGIQRNRNQQAVKRAVQLTTALHAGLRVTSAVSLGDIDASLAFEITALIENLAQSGLSLEPGAVAFGAVQDATAALRSHVSSAAGTLPRVTSYTPPGTIPGAVLAYVLYQDHTREEQDILNRNQIGHPLFIPGGQPLEVTDG